MFVCLGFTAYDPCRLFKCLFGFYEISTPVGYLNVCLFVWVLRHTTLVGYLKVCLFGFYGIRPFVGYLKVCLFGFYGIRPLYII